MTLSCVQNLTWPSLGTSPPPSSQSLGLDFLLGAWGASRGASRAGNRTSEEPKTEGQGQVVYCSYSDRAQKDILTHRHECLGPGNQWQVTRTTTWCVTHLDIKQLCSLPTERGCSEFSFIFSKCKNSVHPTVCYAGLCKNPP